MNADGLCECGCGRITAVAKQTHRKKGHVKGQHIRFVSGHNRKGKGVTPLSYNKAIGRWVINCRDGSRYYWYRAVASNEVGYLLDSETIVHHKDEDSSNDDPSNLEILPSQAEHARQHGIERGGLNERK